MDIKLELAKVIEPTLDGHLTLEEVQSRIEVPKHENQGDYAFPAFVLAKYLHQSPQEIAKALAPKIESELIDHIEVIGPYINFYLNQAKISAEILKEIVDKKEHYGDLEIGQKGNIPIDLSSPNIAKPMSMGHLRSTVIGNAIGNILSKVNFTPIRINHLGDWGTQFGKLIVAYRLWGDEEVVKANPITELNKLYVLFHEKAEEDDSLNDKAREAFAKLEAGDQEELELWKWMSAESLKEFQHVYDLLDIHFDHFTGESFYSDKMPAVIEELEESGLAQLSDGATIVNLDKYDLNPALIKKSDGSTLYITRDLATAKYRKATFDFVQSLYVVGNEQANHFKQLKAVLKEMGYDWSDDMHHIAFGLITSGGHKLSTRKGNTILLDDVLRDSIALALKQIEAKNPDLPDKEEVASEVGVGAVVFHDLKNDRLNSFDFNLEEVVQFEGDTGPYVQYANARANSILEKAGVDVDQLKADHLEGDEAFAIVKALETFPAIVEKAYQEYEPSVIAKYLIGLSQAFNKYYAHTKILVEDEGKESRLALVYAVTVVITEGLRLLGVKAPKSM